MKCFLAAKEHSRSTTYTPVEAFFLGGMLMCSDEHRRYDFVSLVRHNPGYANSRLLAEHRELIRGLASRAGGEITDLDNRRFEGFAVHFRSSRDTDDTILARARAAVANGNPAVLKAMLAGAYDGRASYDRRRGTQANTQFVVDCPQTNGDAIAELIVDLARRLGIGMNTNYSRKRLEGGNPRKTQLRLRSADAERFFTQVGLVSPEKLQRACELYGCKDTVERDPDNLPGLKVMAGRGLANRSRSVSNTTSTTRPRSTTAARHDNGFCGQASSTSAIAAPHAGVSASRPTVDPKLVAKKHLTQEERAKVRVGCHVAHKKFGEGVITTMDDRYMLVQIGGKERKFAWPGAFEDGFLEILDGAGH